MIIIGDRRYMTYAEPIYINKRRVKEIWANNKKVYPCLPEQIRVAVPPQKLVYNGGEEMDYTGIRVEALNPDGSIWKSSKYPSGVIPFDELIFPMTQALMTDARNYVSSDILQEVFGLETVAYVPAGEIIYFMKEEGSDIYYYKRKFSHPSIFLVDSSNGTIGLCVYSFYDPGVDTLNDVTIHYKSWHVYKGSSIIYPEPEWTEKKMADYFYYSQVLTPRVAIAWSYKLFGWSDPEELFPRLENRSKQYNKRSLDLYEAVGWSILFGGSITPIEGQKIPVQWQRPDDGKTLETTFEVQINVRDMDNSTGDGEAAT